MTNTPADISREIGPFPGVKSVNGVTFDGKNLWLATGSRLVAVNPDDGSVVRTLDVAAKAGTAFDGTHLYQIADTTITKIDATSGRVVGSINTPGDMCAGITWAEGSLWVSRYMDREIVQIDAASGRVLRTIKSDRFVTGVAWSNGELWHGSSENRQDELRRVNPETGEVLERHALPAGAAISGVESNGSDGFFCGGGGSGTVRVVRRKAARP